MSVDRVLDAHVHLWDPNAMPIPWLTDDPVLNRVHDLDDYREVTRGIPVSALVYLQVEVAPPYALIEALQIAALAKSEPIIAGIVPWAPLEDGELARVFLESLVAISPLIKGVRRLTQDEPDTEFCLRPGFVQGAALLAAFDLSCDLCCTYLQLAPTVELVRRVPATAFMLDHIAKPNIRDGAFQPWAQQIREMASLPNVACKISGVVTETAGERWTIEEIKPYVMHVLECFGEDRVAFGSDWPVVTGASSYRRWYEALLEMTSELSAEAKRKLWWDNGSTFYRLDIETSPDS